MFQFKMSAKCLLKKSMKLSFFPLCLPSERNIFPPKVYFPHFNQYPLPPKQYFYTTNACIILIMIRLLTLISNIYNGLGNYLLGLI